MRDWKYILYLAIAILAFVLVRLSRPKQYDWRLTLAHDDKNPFGTFVFHNLLPTLFEGKEVRHLYNTIYEVKESLDSTDNLMVVASTFRPDPGDTEAILSHVANGGHALLSAHDFSGIFRDTVGIRVADNLFDQGVDLAIDSSYVRFTNPHLDSLKRFSFRTRNVHNYFSEVDSATTTVVAKNDLDQPVTVRVQWGKGNLILNCTPFAFTNIYLLAGQNQHYVSGMCSYLPPQGRVVRSEYYHLGRMEAATPLRFILRSEPLKWAYYLLIGGIVLFMIFEAKRKQRIIPVITPLANTSLEFVATIGNLYFQKKNHKDIAEKKIGYLLDFIRTRYVLNTSVINEEFFAALGGKSGNPPDEIRKLFRAIAFIQSTTMISEQQLMDLNNKIERFYHQE